MEDKARLRVVLNRLMEENNYSLEEYDRWADLAQKAGLAGVAELIGEAKRSIAEGNGALKRARDLIG